MTYQQGRTDLLAKAGKKLVESLLPPQFEIDFSDHDTGRQMRLRVAGTSEYVWRGSVWHHPQYEFNDEKHIGGIQPGFEFAAPAIDKFFSAVSDAVKRHDEQYDDEIKATTAREEARRIAAINKLRNELTA